MRDSDVVTVERHRHLDHSGLEGVGAGSGSGDLTGSVILLPLDALRNVIQGADRYAIPLTLKAFDADGGELFRIASAADDTLFRVFQGSGSGFEVDAELFSADGTSKFFFYINGGAGPESVFGATLNGVRYIEFDAYIDPDPANSYTKLKLQSQVGQTDGILEFRDEFGIASLLAHATAALTDLILQAGGVGPKFSLTTDGGRATLLASNPDGVGFSRIRADDEKSDFTIHAETDQTDPLVAMYDESGNVTHSTKQDGLAASNAQTLPDPAGYLPGDHGTICDPDPLNPTITMWAIDTDGNLRTAEVPLT